MENNKKKESLLSGDARKALIPICKNIITNFCANFKP